MNIHRQVDQYSRNPFDRYPAGVRLSDEVSTHGLLDTPAARDWFERLDEAMLKGLYSFGLPLDRAVSARSGHGGFGLLVFSTYGYLGLNRHPRIVAAALGATERWGTTSGGVRLLTGTIDLHRECETELASFLSAESAALFSSGYDANLAAISSLLGRGDVAILDEAAHRSIVDGCRMSGCTIRTFRHSDPSHLETQLHRASGRKRVLVAVDGVFSMGGDVTPLREIVALKEKHGAFLLLDESHAIGVLGKDGRGTANAHGLDPSIIDVTTGSLGKAFPSGGGFVAGSRALIAYLQHGSAPYMFSSAITPANTSAIAESLKVVVDEPRHLNAMLTNAEALRGLIRGLDLNAGASESPIVPLILGETEKTYRWARSLLDFSIYASAVPYPAVPNGQSRLRLCATAQHTDDDFARLREALAAIALNDGVSWGDT